MEAQQLNVDLSVERKAAKLWIRHVDVRLKRKNWKESV